MLLINLSYDPNHFILLKNNFQNEFNILDITGALPKDDKIIKATNLDLDFSIKERAVNEMIDALGNVSLLNLNPKEQLRDVEIAGLNLFWQTSISEKNPARNFLINLFYLKKIIETKLFPFSYSRIFLILPAIHSSVYCRSIERYFVKKHSVKVVEFNYNINTTFFAGYRTFAKKSRDNVIKSLRFRKKVMKFDSSSEIKAYANIIVTAVPGTWEENNQEDRVMGKIKEYFNSSDNTYIPYITNFDSKFKWSNKWDRSYLDYFPTKLQIIQHGLNAIFIYKRIKEVKVANFDNFDFIDSNVIMYEFQKVVFEQNYVFLNYLWMKNYFNSQEAKINVFYQDEFYPTGGRFISQAINRSGKSNIISYGYQHGIIYNGHTVYDLTKKELNSTKAFNGMPKPEKFLLWGSFFKELLNKNDAFKDDELIVAGNLNYIVASQKYGKLKSRGKALVILWCTSVDYLVEGQLSIILPFVKTLSDYKLIIRMHPLLNVKDRIFQYLDRNTSDKVTFKNDDNIFDAISGADIILAVTASSIFMDALVLNKLVCQFEIDDYHNDPLPTNNTTLINSAEDLIKVYENILTSVKPNEFLSKQKLLHMNDSQWKKLLLPDLNAISN